MFENAFYVATLRLDMLRQDFMVVVLCHREKLGAGILRKLPCNQTSCPKNILASNIWMELDKSLIEKLPTIKTCEATFGATFSAAELL